MESFNRADAKARLSELVERVETGAAIAITRRGKPVARFVPAVSPRMPVDPGLLDAVTALMPEGTIDGGAFVRRMRDDAAC